MSFAPEGRPFIALALLGLLALGLVAWWRGGWWWGMVAVWIPVAAWVPAFFRDPPRLGPRGEELILAPADGRVTEVVQITEREFMDGPAVRVSIFMNVFDVHVNRHPVTGRVDYRVYRPGSFVNATLDKASEENERMTLGIVGPRGPILVRQIAGLIARRIVTDPDVGDSVQQGERLGLIRFGSRVDTFVPVEVTVQVRPGDRTTAGITVLGVWPS